MAKRGLAGMRAGLPGNPCKWGWRTTDKIRKALGFTNLKMPKSFHGTFRIDGWDIVVKRSHDAPPMYGPHRKARRDRYAPRRDRSAKHRIFVRHNGRLIPAGRIHQLCKLGVVHRYRYR